MLSEQLHAWVNVLTTWLALGLIGKSTTLYPPRLVSQESSICFQSGLF